MRDVAREYQSPSNFLDAGCTDTKIAEPPERMGPGAHAHTYIRIQKRPMYVAKEAYVCGKRGLCGAAGSHGSGRTRTYVVYVCILCKNYYYAYVYTTATV